MLQLYKQLILQMQFKSLNIDIYYNLNLDKVNQLLAF